MTLRGNPVSERATLPDGRVVTIDLRTLDDDYVAERSSTVTLELRTDREVLVSLNTVLDPEQTSEARRLAHEIRRGLEAGELEPTTGDLEPLADEPSRAGARGAM